LNIKTLEMVRNIRDAHYEQLKDKSRKERILFYREKADKLHSRLSQKQTVGWVEARNPTYQD